MLIEQKPKLLFIGAYTTLVCLQVYSAWHHQLFGDEAFYWLESQHLAWSYTELPGWTQWSIAFSQWLLPANEFTIRLPGLLAAWSLPWLGMALHKQLTATNSSWQTGLLLLSLPLLAVAGIMAVPDIWLLFFGTLSLWAWFNCLANNKPTDYLLLGLLLALGLNTHVRFWLILLLASGVVFWQYRHHKAAIIKLLGYTLPVLALGLLPILWFNLQQDFALLNFQLSDRHPWQFQATHFSFFVVQFLLVTPLVFCLCMRPMVHMKSLRRNQRTVLYIALLHWLCYALIGFFSDNLRFNAHWPLFSYFLLLLVAGSGRNGQALKSGAIITGVLGSVALLVVLFYALHIAQPVSQLNARLTENFRGWQALADKTTAVSHAGNYDYIVTDHFMTLAQLKYYTDTAKITSLSHPANLKHGREQQLNIMGYIQGKRTGNGLLVVEHSALKLTQMMPFYLSACETLNGIALTDTLDHAKGLKTHHFFTTGGGQCLLPPISYLEPETGQLSGWVLTAKDKPPKIRLNTVFGNPSYKPKATPLGNNALFQGLDDQQYQLLEFKFTNTPSNSAYQVQFNYPELTVMSPTIYPE